MAFDFDKLKPEAKRAAFAHMRLGGGGRHKRLSAKKKAAVEHGGRGKVSGKLGSGTVKGQLSPADHDKGSMGGKLPVAKARPAARKPAAPSPPDTPEARFDSHVAARVRELTGDNTGGFAGMADLRKSLDKQGFSRAEQDTHLKRMSAEGKLHIVPEENRKALTQADHDAAIRIGGEPNHLVALTDKAPGKESAAADSRVDPYAGRLSQAYMRGGKPTESDHALLASRYLEMHGDAGVQKKIAQLEKRKRLGPGDRALLAALKSIVRK